ncbi:MAG TPA: hypothetical protein VNK96_02425 [Fimbriimonadales bacterium]|nr:hypothetical protein [Fimbriimonadales bacterium]
MTIGIFLATFNMLNFQIESAQTLFDRVNAKLASAKSISGVMIEKTNFGKTSTRYEFAVLKPNYYKIKSKQNEKYYDGMNVYWYNKVENEYSISNVIKQTNKRIPIKLPGFESFTGQSLDYLVVRSVKDTIFNGRSCKAISLDYKGIVQPPRFNTFFVDPKTLMPLGWELRQEDMWEITIYENLRLNPPLKPSDFIWKVPSSARLKNVNAQIKIGDKAPDFTLKGPNGETVSLNKTLTKSKAVLINFWYYG